MLSTMLGLDDQPNRLIALMNASSPESAAFPWFRKHCEPRALVWEALVPRTLRRVT
jgi:hypothetical protein